MGNIHVYYNNIPKISETAWPIKAKFYRKHLREGGINMFINNSGHVIKMAAMPIYGKNPLKFFFSGTTGLISTKLGMKRQGLEYYNDLDPFYDKVNIGRPCI